MFIEKILIVNFLYSKDFVDFFTYFIKNQIN